MRKCIIRVSFEKICTSTAGGNFDQRRIVIDNFENSGYFTKGINFRDICLGCGKARI